MERTLVVVRHAKSDWDVGVEDHDRPLNERGRRDAPALGAWLRDNVDGIGLVVCSSAARARQTWRLASAALEPAPPVRYEQRVYAAEPSALMSVLDEVADDVGTTALVGHNPGLTELVEEVSGQAVELTTSAVAVLRWDGAWADVWARRATLVAQATPRG
ncbi:SixA phosphatase family protein [Actinophytocola gossypii]|uniref:Histidine phosphatase family protein n=1 Tax=Actinophytocola gossypii TaxID=2812003 RepID=A0ABT2JFP7_9PSEU|nr:histidine phosphatase family protein [Actinophytocola gossypii]MCT2586697.1 histidine phosphatase family protein [Actinophytocola gossypii]